MQFIFWLAIGAILYVYLGYPLTLWLLGCFGRMVPKRAAMTPYVTLLISAYNEKMVIRTKLENSLALDYPADRLEVLVASESVDGTNEVVAEFASRGVRLCAYTGRTGKAATLYRTMPQARGEIIVFSDANAMYAPDAVQRLIENFADPRIGCVSGLLCYENAGQSIVGEGESSYWNYETVVKCLESDQFSLLGANGSIFAIRKELYNPISEMRGDDFELPIRILECGHGAILDTRARSWEASCERSEEEFSRKKRIVRWNLQSALILLHEAVEKRLWFLCFQMVSHKLLRWCVPVFLVLALASTPFLSSPFRETALAGQGLVYGLGVGGYLFERRHIAPSWIFKVPFYFCMVNLAALMGIFAVMMGETRNTWEKVR